MRKTKVNKLEKTLLEKALIEKAFLSIENHDIKLSTVLIFGNKSEQKRTLKDLKNWKKN